MEPYNWHIDQYTKMGLVAPQHLLNREYLVILDGVIHRVNSIRNILARDAFAQESRKGLAEFIGVQNVPESSNYLVVNIDTQQFMFVFDKFHIFITYDYVDNQHTNGKYQTTYAVRKFDDQMIRPDIIMRLNECALDEIYELLNEINDNSMLMLYKKLCDFGVGFVEQYSQLSDWWPATNVKSAKVLPN